MTRRIWQTLPKLRAKSFAAFSQTKDKFTTDTMGGSQVASGSMPRVLSSHSESTEGIHYTASPEPRKACEAFWSVPY